MKRFAQQQATCTRGPSFPSHMPDATARHYGSVSHMQSQGHESKTYQSQRLSDQCPTP